MDDRMLVVLDSPDAVYSPGNVVCGRVVVELQRPKIFKVILVHVAGIATCKYINGSGKGKETYIDETITLWGDSGGWGNQHSVGHQSYPFTVELPTTLPSSFESGEEIGTGCQIGNIRYSCKAIADPGNEDGGGKMTSLKTFSVIRPLDLNSFSDAHLPMHQQLNEDVSGCCDARGNISMLLHSEKTGFVPGETIPLSVKVVNNSHDIVTYVKVQLRQHVDFWVQEAVDSDPDRADPARPITTSSTGKYRLAKFKYSDAIESNCSHEMNLSLLVPKVPGSNLEGCDMMDVKYFIVVSLVSSWASMQMTQKFMVGTIPLSSAHIASNNSGYDSANVFQQPPPPPSYNSLMGGPAIQYNSPATVGPVTTQPGPSASHIPGTGFVGSTPTPIVHPPPPIIGPNIGPTTNQHEPSNGVHLQSATYTIPDTINFGPPSDIGACAPSITDKSSSVI